MRELSIAAMKRLIKTQGDKRVSESAARELRDILETFVRGFAETAISGVRNKTGKQLRKMTLSKQ